MKLIVPLFVFILFALGFSLYQEPELKESIKRGSEIYSDFCVNCHMDNGEGVPNSFPPLAASDFLIKNRAASIHAVKFGLKGEIIVNGITYNNSMTSFGLEDDEIADVMNFVMNSWGNKQTKMVTIEEVQVN
ncbi:cytochrome c [uncultured Maribacter sp.]|uniref:c-type cytochrome n=1 Tax=uncultured Maribacter sp. TaxID=431308 RepID=UPI0030DD5932|tara:strand:+ start:158 stop:553 length:396 start_codon:yes stop_codon:yes gene_type:complete